MLNRFIAEAKTEYKADKPLACPPLYILKKDGKVAYLLGTYHILPLEALPKTFLELINKEVKYFVSESTGKLSFEDLIEIQILVNNQAEWFSKLSSRAQEAFKIAADIFFKNRTTIETPADLNQINLRIAKWIFYLSRYSNGMDNVLEKTYFPNTNYLESTLEHFATIQHDLCDLQDLERILTTELPNRSQAYLQGINFFRTPSVYTIHFDTKRNIKWINRIIELHSTYSDIILFGVGGAHLLGATGLIELLKKFGFEIQRLDLFCQPVEEPKPSSYPDERLIPLMENAFQNAMPGVIHANSKLPEQPCKLISGYLSIFDSPQILSEQLEMDATSMRDAANTLKVTAFLKTS